MFGKKKKEGICVMHYEGIAEFSTDYPCNLKLNEDVLTVKRLKPETTVTLPKSRIKSISAMEEENFMLKYHGHAVSTAKFGKKYYLVITYDKGHLAFWGTAKEYSEFIKMQYEFENAPTTVSI